MGEFELYMLGMFGWMVVEVEALHDHGCAVTSQRVALIRAGLADDERGETAARLLEAALTAES